MAKRNSNPVTVGETSASDGQQPAAAMPARRRLYESLSCITVDDDSGPYELKGLDYFDVPDETYADGNLTGARVASELISTVYKDGGFSSLADLLKGAASVLYKEADEAGDTPCKRGAAVGLFFTLQQVLEYASARVDLSPVFRESFDYYQGLQEERVQKHSKRLAQMRKANASALAALPHVQ